MANGALATNPTVQTQAVEAPDKTLGRLQTRLKYLQRVRPKDPEIKKLQGRIKTYTPSTQPSSSPTVAEQQQALDQQVGQTSGDIFNKMGSFAETFDPTKFQMQYQPVYGEQADQAYNAIMSQFDIRNQKAFEQQKEALDIEAANKGWSPSGEMYQRRFREMQDAQNQARQEAQNQALMARQGVQQQSFEQAQTSALMPGQIWGQFAAPYMAQYGTRAAQDLAAQQQQFNKELAALENKYRLQQIRATPRGGGGGGGGGGVDPMAAFNQYITQQTLGRYQDQPQGTNPVTTGAQSFAQTFGTSLYK